MIDAWCRRHGHQRGYLCPTARLAEERDIVRSAAECGDVISHPMECSYDIELSRIRRNVTRAIRICPRTEIGDLLPQRTMRAESPQMPGTASSGAEQCAVPSRLHRMTTPTTGVTERELAFANLMCELNTGQGDRGRRERLQSMHGGVPSLHGAVVLLSTSGEPLGSPGTPQIKALVDFVTAGGGLVAINNANHAYDDSTTNPSTDYISLIGADFNGQTTYGPGTCAPVGTNASVATLPATFDIVDEVYNFKNVNPDVEVVLTCKNTPTAAPRAVSWVRAQGAGRVFYTSLGKQDHSWLPPELLVPNHVLPGLLWTMKRR